MKTKSFTLIELLVVIVIIGILAGVIIVSTSSSISKANFAKAQAFSNTVQQELLLNLVSEWTFDEGGAEDTWGNNDGTVTGATYQNKDTGNCVYGGCYSFDGNDYIESVDFPEIKEKLTVSAWINPENFANMAILSKWGAGSQFLFNIHESGKITLESPDNIIYDSNSFIKINTWQFVLISLDGSYVRHYINGILDKQQEQSNLLQFSQKTLQIGHLEGFITWYFNGYIDDVRIYNGALSSSEIKQEYIAGLDSLLINGNISKEEYDQRLNNLAQK